MVSSINLSPLQESNSVKCSYNTHDLVWKWFWNVQKISISATENRWILWGMWIITQTQHRPVGSYLMVHTKTISGRKTFDYTYAWYRLIHFVTVQNDIKKQPFGLTLYKTASPSCALSGALKRSVQHSN